MNSLWNAAANPVFRHAMFAGLIGLLFTARPLLADVEVTLKTGASIVGEVTIVGEEAVVKIDDSELRVPLKEIATIGSANTGPERQAQRLLLTALQARLTDDGAIETIGVLAEASRLAPKDPHIAYWYASSLADSGYGQAANDVLEKQRAAIEAAYPGLVEQLAKRIKRRVEMERMPPALVERIDKLNAELAKQSPAAEQRPVAAMFRLVDQDKVPIERTAFRMQCNNGQEENLESYDDGYFLYTYNRHRSNEEQPSNIDMIQPGLESKVFDLAGSSNSVRDAGELVVKRYGEESKKPIRVQVAGSDAKPIAGARVSLQPLSARGNAANESLSGETDAEGQAEFVAFPMKYSISVQADGYNGSGGSTELKADASELKPVELQLNRAIEATIRLAWESTSMQGGGRTTGDATVHVGGPQRPQYGPDQNAWLRPFQQKDRLSLQFMDAFFGHGPFGEPPEGWVRILDKRMEAADETKKDEPNDDDTAEPATAATDAEASPKKPEPLDLDAFNKLELSKIDELKAKLPVPRLLAGGQQMGPRQPIVVAAELGKIYVGQLQHRDPRTGQPMQIAYKVFIEEMSSADGGTK